MKTKQKETLQVFRRSDLDNLFSKNGHVESGTDMLIKGECCAASEVTVVYCEVTCLPYPVEWGTWFVGNGHTHNVESSGDYFTNVHKWQQVMWFGDILDNGGGYKLPFGILYGMHT
ncbi:hypothetical protein LCGC14_2801200, partial [marine sediment metagenome]